MSGNVSPKEVSIENLKEEIHALLCTVKGSVPSDQLLKDYKSVCGAILPYRQLGFSNINDLLKSMPDVVSCHNSNGNVLVKAVLKNESAHINKLVQGQKGTKKRPRMLQAYPIQRGPGSLLRNPINANNRPAAPWNFPKYYVPPAMRSIVVVPQNSTIRQAMIPRLSQQPPPQQIAAPPAQQQGYQAPHLKQPAQLMQPKTSQTTSLPMVKFPQVHQRPPPPINLQLPGAHAIPVSTGKTGKPTVSPLPIVRPNNFHREKLQRFVLLHRLGEITYEDAKMKNGRYVATVVIDKKKSSCYPDEFATKEDAYEKAAEVALSEWESKYHDKIRKTSVTTDDKIMAKRVVDIVSKHSGGCWSEEFVKLYEYSFYGESLPEDWVQRVKAVTDELEFTAGIEHFLVCMATTKKTPEPVTSSPFLSREPLFNQPPPSNESFYNQSVSELFTQPVSKEMQPQKSHGSIPDESACRPIPVQHIDSDVWVVHVLVVCAGDQLAIRRIDSEQYSAWEEMMNDMDLFYSEHEASLTPVGLLERGCLYASQIDGIWARVELMAYTENGDVELKLVDYADVETVVPSSVFPLEKKFGEVPTQGIKCLLHGLSSFANSEHTITTEIDRLLNNQFVARVVSREPHVSIILYESPSEINMNEWILEQVAEKLPMMPLKVGPVVQKSIISYVSSACDVYMSRDTPQKNVVDCLVSLLQLRVEQSLLPATLIADGLYLGRSEKHGWCRMRLYSSIPTHDGNVSVQLMDFGDTELVPGNTLRELQSMSPVLARIPDQAVRVVLARLPPPSCTFTEKAAKTLREFTPPGLSLMVRVQEFRNGIPVVELFERIEESGKLVTINAMMEMDESLYRSTDQVTVQPALPKTRLDADMSQRVAAMTLPSRRSSTSSSPSPTFQMERVVVPEADIPAIDTGRFLTPFDVQVFNVSNPDHFYVHSVHSLQLLNTLMLRLKEYCNRDDVKMTKLDPPSIVVDGFYAAWHSKTESYRRVHVIGKSGSMISVAFVDHGEIDIVPLSGIRALLPEFAELPAQAMKAQLFGVKPTAGDWSPQNALFFKKFVDNRVFSSYVMEVLQDKTLRLQLNDVLSGEKDIDVAKYLVENCHATVA